MHGACPRPHIIHVFQRRDENITQADDLCKFSLFSVQRGVLAYVFMPKVLQQLEFPICTLREYRSAEGLHNLLDRHRLAGELVLCRTTPLSLAKHATMMVIHANRCRTSIPHQAKRSHSHRLQVGIPGSPSTTVSVILSFFPTREVN
jgi:hypothetical protein